MSGGGLEKGGGAGPALKGSAFSKTVATSHNVQCLLGRGPIAIAVVLAARVEVLLPDRILWNLASFIG